MKTIYIEGTQWRDHTLDRAAGDAGRLAGPCCRDTVGLQAGEDKVIDLAAWKAENLVEPDVPEPAEERPGGLGQYGGRELVRRRRGKREALLARAELAATLAAAGLMAAMILRVLVF